MVAWDRWDVRAHLTSLALAVVGDREEHTDWVRGYFYAMASFALAFGLKEEACESMKIAQDGASKGE